MPLRVARRQAFTIAASILVAVATVVVLAALQSARDRTWVDHTYQVLASLAEIELLQEQASAASRGLALFNRDTFVRQFVERDEALVDRLIALPGLVADNPPQAARARQLERAMYRRMAFPRSGIRTFREHGIEALRNRYGDIDDLALAQADVTRLLSEMKAEEVRLLGLRADAAARATNIVLALALLGIPLSLLILRNVYAQLKGEIVQRDAAELRLDHANRELQAMAATLREDALRDPLTGLYNRRYLDEATGREIARCLRRELPLAVLMLDIDHFRQFNTQYGHAGGDKVLVAVADLLRRFSRQEDIACRLGGEEFAVVMPEATSEVARARAAKIRAELGQLEVTIDGAVVEAVTVSVGVACLRDDGSTAEALMRTADMRLYQAKNRGRDRVVWE